MSRRIELPSGGWVELAESTAVTERQRRPVRAAMARLSAGARDFLASPPVDPDDPGYQRALANALTADPGDLDAMYEVGDHVAACLVASASFLADGVKCTTDHVAELAGADYDALTAATAEYIGAFIEGVNFEPTLDRATPTGPSSA